MARGVWGVDIRSLDTGEQLFERDAGRLMMPASNMKILTLAVATRVLGWDYRFITTLETFAPVEGGVLRGDLFVRSNGDPTINTRDGRAGVVLTEWVDALRAAGIQRIDGRIIGDDQAFDDEGIGAGWAWDYLQFGYAAPVGALQCNEDLATLNVRPAAQAGTPAVVTLSPGSGLQLLNRALTVEAGSRTSVSYRRHLESPILEVSGSIAADATATDRTAAVVNPTVFCAHTIKDELTARGIPVSGPAVDFDDVAAEFAGVSGERRVLARTQSPPLRDIAVVLMKVSQNLYAETLVKATAAARGGLGTAEWGLSVIRTVLTSWGVPDDSFVNADGSGLSRYNYITPATITTILERLYKSDTDRAPFVATLPVAGKDGTLATRLRGTRAEGNATAKTGSIANVRSLSGYVRSRDGEMLVFSIIANDFVVPAETINHAADLAVEHLSNFTRR